MINRKTSLLGTIIDLLPKNCKGYGKKRVSVNSRGGWTNPEI